MQSPDRMLLQGGRLLAGEALRFDVTPSGLHHALPGLGVCDVDADGWRLVVGGHTRYALGLSLAGVQRRPARTASVVLQTPGLPGAASQARWTGTPLSQVLHEAAPLDGAGHVVFNGLDRGIVDGVARRGEIRLPLEVAMADDVLLAWAMNGHPLPEEHGHPLRLLVPGREEWASLRWLTAISVAEGPLPDGREPARLAPQALLEPPGLLERDTGRRVVDAGSTALSGRAWSGDGVVNGIEFSTDGGESWRAATLAETATGTGWSRWNATWAAGAGSHRLGSRALGEHGDPGEASFLEVQVR